MLMNREVATAELCPQLHFLNKNRGQTFGLYKELIQAQNRTIPVQGSRWSSFIWPVKDSHSLASKSASTGIMTVVLSGSTAFGKREWTASCSYLIQLCYCSPQEFKRLISALLQNNLCPNIIICCLISRYQAASCLHCKVAHDCSEPSETNQEYAGPCCECSGENTAVRVQYSKLQHNNKNIYQPHSEQYFQNVTLKSHQPKRKYS
mmetsp:Transcript_481/g.996  ORF Transcript_481/g.996 Transcript_481/m.996 type:complete len:206 (-) Transcript_481:1965-2582(-)